MCAIYNIKKNIYDKIVILILITKYIYEIFWYKYAVSRTCIYSYILFSKILPKVKKSFALRKP